MNIIHAIHRFRQPKPLTDADFARLQTEALALVAWVDNIVNTLRLATKPEKRYGN